MDKTDLERFIELYQSLGIECIVNQLGENKIIYLINTWENGIKLKSVTNNYLLQNLHSKVKRYTAIFFDLQNNYLYQRIL